MQEAPPALPSSVSPPADPPADPVLVIAHAEEVIGELLKRLGFEARISSSVESKEIRLRILVEEPARLIGRRGATINDLQFLVNRILQRSFTGMPRLYLDVTAPEDKEVAQISEPLRTLAEHVRRWGNPADLGSLNAVERQAAIDAFARDRELEVVPVSPAPNGNGLQPMRLQLRGER
jgi:spoIIIJ-associated protein